MRHSPLPVQAAEEGSREDAVRLEGLLPLALSALEAALRRGPEVLGRTMLSDADSAVVQARSRIRSKRLQCSDGCAGVAPKAVARQPVLGRGLLRVRQVCPA